MFREAGPELWRAVYVFTGGRRELAEEAVAEAFTRALERWESIEQPRAWLYRVAFRVASAELKRERREPPAPEEAAAHDPDSTRNVLDALRKLPPNQRASIVLHYRIDMPVKEIARVLGISAATVKVHLYRGRNRLRELLGAEGGSDD